MLLRLTLLVLAFTASGLATGESPGRMARLSYVEGPVTFRSADEVAPSALPDRPLNVGDRISTARDGRAELALGNATLRLDEDTTLEVTELDESAVRLELTAGTASLHLRELYENETYEIVALNTTIGFMAPGEYRVDITPSDATDLSVRTGNAEVATAGGPVRVADGQRVRLEGRAEFASLVTPRAADDFDDWVLEREVQLAEATPPVDESSGYYADETLDEYGEWRDDPGYGRVWMPSYAYGGYDPIGYGHWQYNGYGYSWYNPMPWGPYTSHYGRWTYLDDLNRWAWVSERQAQREHRRRVERRADQLDEALDDLGSQDGRRDTRPFGRSTAGDAERRARATSDEVARRIDADRKPVFNRSAKTDKAPRAKVVPRSAPDSQDNSTPTVRPSRPASASTSNKSFGKPQDP